MKLKFKHQKSQADTAKAVCDVFTGQPLQSVIFDPVANDNVYRVVRLFESEDIDRASYFRR